MNGKTMFIGLVSSVAALNIVLRPALGTTMDVPALKDAMMFGTSTGGDTGNASGKGPALFAGDDGSGNHKRSLIAFDLSSIPSDATIQSVTMTLYLAQVGGSGGSSGGGTYPSRTIRLYALQQDWGEGASGSPTAKGVGGSGQGYTRVNGDSSWDYAVYNSNPAMATLWQKGLTTVEGGNFASVESGEATFTSFGTLNAPFTWSSTSTAADNSQMVRDVQNWVDGAAANDGWLLKSDLEGNNTSFLGFWSKDGAAANGDPTVAHAPVMSVSYTVPEPATAGLLVVGLAAIVRRRRGV